MNSVTREELIHARYLLDTIDRYKYYIDRIEACDGLTLTSHIRGEFNDVTIEVEKETKTVILDHYKRKLKRLEKEFAEL